MYMYMYIHMYCRCTYTSVLISLYGTPLAQRASYMITCTCTYICTVDIRTPVFLISLYGTPLAQRASYLVLSLWA